MGFHDHILDSGLFSSPGDLILLPLRGFPSERDAMFLALVTAEYFGCSLRVVHVTNKSDKIEDFFLKEIDWLRNKSEEMRVQLDVFIKDSSKSFDNAILEEINTLAPKLTIIMSRQKSFFQRLSVSFSERIARRSRHSVMVIRSPLKDWVTYGSHVSPRKIVVPIGFGTPNEMAAVQIAIAIANAGEKMDAEIILLHAIIIPETVPIMPEDDKMIINEEKNFVKLAGMLSTLLLFPMKTKVVVGRDVGRSVSSFLNKEHADLAILGVPYLPKRFFGLFGTDTNEIYNKSGCPIAAIFLKDI
ncbi:MAG: universal stress protein [Asgard group archaeon]|nr:universal stress protein [Asgard group archaeon]